MVLNFFFNLEGFILLFQFCYLLWICLGCWFLLGLILVTWLNLESHPFISHFHLNGLYVLKELFTIFWFFGIFYIVSWLHLIPLIWASFLFCLGGLWVCNLDYTLKVDLHFVCAECRNIFLKYEWKQTFKFKALCLVFWDKCIHFSKALWLCFIISEF